MSKREICKMLDEAIGDERKACKEDYVDLADRLWEIGEYDLGDGVAKISEDECRHRKELIQIKKEISCR